MQMVSLTQPFYKVTITKNTKPQGECQKKYNSVNLTSKVFNQQNKWIIYIPNLVQEYSEEIGGLNLDLQLAEPTTCMKVNSSVTFINWTRKPNRHNMIISQQQKFSSQDKRQSIFFSILLVHRNCMITLRKCIIRAWFRVLTSI